MNLTNEIDWNKPVSIICYEFEGILNCSYNNPDYLFQKDLKSYHIETYCDIYVIIEYTPILLLLLFIYPPIIRIYNLICSVIHDQEFNKFSITGKCFSLLFIILCCIFLEIITLGFCGSRDTQLETKKTLHLDLIQDETNPRKKSKKKYF